MVKCGVRNLSILIILLSLFTDHNNIITIAEALSTSRRAHKQPVSLFTLDNNERNDKNLQVPVLLVSSRFDRNNGRIYTKISSSAGGSDTTRINLTNSEMVEDNINYATEPDTAINNDDNEGGKDGKICATWEFDIARLIRERAASIISEELNDNHRPLLVAIVGIPGSGKTTSASILSHLLLLDEPRPLGNVVMPMDGYHIPMRDLRLLPDADDAIYRRGAPDTFDAACLKNDLERIKGKIKRNSKEKGKSFQQKAIQIPGFDHAKGDPEPNAHTFLRNEHAVVLCEGLYLLHDSDGWGGISDLFDLSIYVDANIDTCIDRLKVRNRCIPGYTIEEIEKRCDAVDRVNAHTVLNSRSFADIVVTSTVA